MQHGLFIIPGVFFILEIIYWTSHYGNWEFNLIINPLLFLKIYIITFLSCTTFLFSLKLIFVDLYVLVKFIPRFSPSYVNLLRTHSYMLGLLHQHHLLEEDSNQSLLICFPRSSTSDLTLPSSRGPCFLNHVTSLFLVLALSPLLLTWLTY